MIIGMDKLTQQLNAIGNINTKSAAVAGLTVIKDESQQNTPVDEGNLRDHQYVLEQGDGAVLEIQEPYALFVEMGTSVMSAQPYIRPAIDSKSDEAVKAAGEEVERLMRTAI